MANMQYRVVRESLFGNGVVPVTPVTYNDKFDAQLAHAQAIKYWETSEGYVRTWIESRQVSDWEEV